MPTKIVRAIITGVLGLIIFFLVFHTAGIPGSANSFADILTDLRYPGTKGGTLPLPKASKDVVLNLLDDPIPRRNFTEYAEYPPHNVKVVPKYAYATLLCTRQPDMRDPFFAATQSLVWRLLWSRWHGAYPVIVFVCPFIPEEQRIMLRGQGATIKEIGLLDNFIPVDKIPVARWVDQFSKLNMWKETEYDMIAYLDVDAFPIANIDDVFTLAPLQECSKDLLTSTDEKLFPKDKPCEYIFAGIDPYGQGEVNGGFLLFKPDLKIYERLLAHAKKIEEYDITKMEQGLLHSKLGFGQDGPFKAHLLPQVYNAVPDFYVDHREDDENSPEGPLRVIHDKLWNVLATQDRPELGNRWSLDWIAMCRFYDGDVFTFARETGRLKSDLEIFLEGAAPQDE